MKPQLLKVQVGPSYSFSVRRDVGPYFYNRWHYHPEVELIHIQKGSGTQFIGDSIQRFKEGDVLLVGANLPHYWRCDDAYFQKDSGLTAMATVAHFREDFWGRDFLNLAENTKLKDLLEKAKNGLLIKGDTKKLVAACLDDMRSAEETGRIILLLQALYQIAHTRQYNTISKTIFSISDENKETERINDVYKFSLQNYKTKISLNEIASVANISPQSFCRYFKSRTRKNYSTFLQELRVGHATKLLIENKENITQICYKSGFNNITNFYKAFKKVTGKTPLEYQKHFVEV
jgi:AraC-like DNA-binding protein